MKGKYTIEDKRYRKALSIVSEELENKGIDYTIIGGGAVQIHICSILGDTHLKDHLRKTGDIDIVIDANLEKLVLMFNELAGIYKNISNQGIGTAIIDGVSISYSTPSNLKGFEDYQDLVLYESKRKHVDFKSYPIDVNVENPELIIAAKLTGSYKPKDIFDIKQLHDIFKLKRRRLNQKKLLRILKKIGKEDKFITFTSIISQTSS